MKGQKLSLRFIYFCSNLICSHFEECDQLDKSLRKQKSLSCSFKKKKNSIGMNFATICNCDYKINISMKHTPILWCHQAINMVLLQLNHFNLCELKHFRFIIF